MPALQTLKSRNSANFIQGKYIDRVLKEESLNILRAQDRVISRYGVRQKIQEIGKRRFTISNGTAIFEHPIRERFIDMKYRAGTKQKPVPIHNKVIYAGFNRMVGQLAFGLTQDVKDLIANEYNVEL